MFLCSFCDKSFNQHRNLRRHVKAFHDVGTPVPSLKSDPLQWFSCSFCTKKYRSGKLLRTHCKKEHPESMTHVKAPAVVQNTCPLQCGFSNNNKIKLIKHLSEVHKIKIESECFTCPDYQTFLSWKKTMQNETKSKYLIRSKHLLNNLTRYHFPCYRSGYFRSKSKGMRHLKVQGSNKINATCPANLLVKENNVNGECEVTYLKTHIGHSTLEKSNTTAKAKKALRTRHKLSLAVSIENVIETEEGWLVPSKNNVDDLFSVKKSKELCNSCPLSCAECKSCIHNYTCTCVDNSDMLNMCQHIHLVCRSILSKQYDIFHFSMHDFSGPVVTVVSDECEILNENQDEMMLVTLNTEDGDIEQISDALEMRKRNTSNILNELLATVASIEEMDIIDEIIAEIEPRLYAVCSRISIFNKSDKITDTNFNLPRKLFITKKPAHIYH